MCIEDFISIPFLPPAVEQRIKELEARQVQECPLFPENIHLYWAEVPPLMKTQTVFCVYDEHKRITGYCSYLVWGLELKKKFPDTQMCVHAFDPETTTVPEAISNLCTALAA